MIRRDPMKKKRFALVLVAGSIMLTACGHSKTYDLVAPTEEMKALLNSDYTPSLEIEKAEFSIQAIADSSLEPGVIVEVQEGEPGVKKSVYRTYLEGEGENKEENKTLFSQIILKESKAEIVHYGPKKDDSVKDGDTVEVGTATEALTDQDAMIRLLKDKNLVGDDAEMMSKEEAEKLSREKKEKEEKKKAEEKAQEKNKPSSPKNTVPNQKKPAANSNMPKKPAAQQTPSYPKPKKPVTPQTPQTPPANQNSQKTPNKPNTSLPQKNPDRSNNDGNRDPSANQGLTDKELNPLLNTNSGKNDGGGNAVPEKVN